MAEARLNTTGLRKETTYGVTSAVYNSNNISTMFQLCRGRTRSGQADTKKWEKNSPGNENTVRV